MHADPLHQHAFFCCNESDLAFVDLMRKRGADLNMVDERGKIPLSLAIEGPNKGVCLVPVLLAHNEDSLSNCLNETKVNCCVAGLCYAPSLKALVPGWRALTPKERALTPEWRDLTLEERNFLCVFFVNCINNTCTVNIENYVKGGGNLNIRVNLAPGQFADPVNDSESLDLSPLMWVAAAGNEPFVRTLLVRKDVAINLRDAQNNTALHYAARNGHAGIVSLLLEDPRIISGSKNKRGMSARQLLIEELRRELQTTCLYVLAARPINFREKRDCKDFHDPLEALSSIDREFMTFILQQATCQTLPREKLMEAIAGYIQRGANGNLVVDLYPKQLRNTKGERKLTPLCCAVGLGNVDLVNALLAQGSVDCNVLDGAALDLAAYLEWNGLVGILKARSTRQIPEPQRLNMHFNHGKTWEIFDAFENKRATLARSLWKHHRDNGTSYDLAWEICFEIAKWA